MTPTSFNALEIRRKLGRGDWSTPTPFGPDGWAMVNLNGKESIVITVMKAYVYFSATADLTVHVEIPDDLEPQEARDAALDAAYDALPRSLCAHCSGWGQPWSRDVGEWEPIDENPVDLGDEAPSNSSPVGADGKEG